jgi:hypothetical protein
VGRADSTRPTGKSALLEVEDIQDDSCVAIPQHDVPSDDHAFAIGRRRGKPTLQFDRNHVYPAFQARRKRAADHKLPLQSGRQAISPGETRREVFVMFSVPTANFVAVMVRESVAATIVIVVVLSVSVLVSPMSVVVVPAAILVVLVFICKSGVCRQEKKSKNNGGNPFSSFQRFLQDGVG